MKKKFGVNVGISDHTIGGLAPVVAVSLGATVVEKHFILDKKLGGIDSAFSMEPKEFKDMVKNIRDAELSLGEIVYDVPEEKKLKRRSLFVVKDIKKGEKFNSENIRSIRPGYGLHPKNYEKIINKVASKNIEKGTRYTYTNYLFTNNIISRYYRKKQFQRLFIK